MRKYSLYTGVALAMLACNSAPASKVPGTDSVKPAATNAPVTSTARSTDNALTDTTKVKTWIIKVVEDYGNATELNVGFENLRNALTNDYYHYKQEALNLEYDNEDTLTVEGFEKKWKHKYDTKYVGEGGYIISAPDNGRVKVSEIYLLKHAEDKASFYRVVIDDMDFKASYKRDFKVIVENGKYRIDDILEYN